MLSLFPLRIRRWRHFGGGSQRAIVEEDYEGWFGVSQRKLEFDPELHSSDDAQHSDIFLLAFNSRGSKTEGEPICVILSTRLDGYGGAYVTWDARTVNRATITAEPHRTATPNGPITTIQYQNTITIVSPTLNHGIANSPSQPAEAIFHGLYKPLVSLLTP